MNIGLGIGIPFTRSNLWTSIFTPTALFMDGSTEGVWYDPSDIKLNWRRNLLTETEFRNGLTDAPIRGGLVSATTLDRYQGAIAFGYDGITTSYAYKSISITALTTYSISVVVEMSDGLAPVFGSAGEGLPVNDFVFVVAANVVSPITYSVKNFGGTLYRVSATYTTPSPVNGLAVGIVKYGANSSRAFKVSAYQLEQGSIATPYQRITDGVQDYLQYQAQPVLYRDAAGTLPVTAVEQPVGLMKDKSGGGNHAFNSSGNSANFPVLSARYNLLTKTEDFSDAVWSTVGTVTRTPNYAVAPDGTTTAQRVVFSQNTSTDQFFQGAPVSAINYVQGVWLKVPSGSAQIKFGVYDGAIKTSALTLTTTWQYFTATQLLTAGVGARLMWLYPDGAGYATEIYVWHPDVRVANDALNQPAYQRVNTATDYDTVGFPLSLRFNGVNQWLQTNSIDFSYSDKMFVCAGVRKLSDAATGMLFETSAGAQVGSFSIRAPQGATNRYSFVSSGTFSGQADSSLSYASPITNVVSGISNISGDQSILRINGAQAAISTADQGIGNYGNYPLYIGARAGTSLWFNGRLYQLVIAAGSEIRVAEEDSDLFLSESGDFITAETTVAVIQSAIEQTEAFVNRKTSAF